MSLLKELKDDLKETRLDVGRVSGIIETEVLKVIHNINELKDDVYNLKDDVYNLKDDVRNVDNNVDNIRKDVISFKNRFENFVKDLEKKNNITHAQGEMIIVNQELEKKFGLYEKVRKYLLGILQSVDTGLVSKRAITEATEDLMLGTPKYWLTPSLVALASWINNNKDLAQRALNEGLTRHQLKTVLIFTLICNRLKRRDASFMWLSKYFENQNPLEMPQETLILVNAYTDGVFGPDSQGECLVQLRRWLDYLAKQPEKVEELQNNWFARINVLLPVNKNDQIGFQYLPKYSTDFQQLEDLLNKARKNEAFHDYLKDIFQTQTENRDYLSELDEILYKLVEEYDADEYELRKKHKMCELILKHDGDKELAEEEFNADTKTLFKDKVTFFDILTNAVISEDSSPSMRKLAIMLMKEWIINAYNDFTVQYRNSYPQKIDIKISTWNGSTKDGSDSEELYESYKNCLELKLQQALADYHVSYLGIAVLCGFVFWAFFNCGGIQITGIILSVIYTVFRWIKASQSREILVNKFNSDCKNGKDIINAVCAEYVDWQKEYKEADAYSEKVTDYLNNYSAEDFTENNAGNKILMFDTEV